MDLIARYLREDDIPYVELNGRTVIKLRNDIVLQFNKEGTRQKVSTYFMNVYIKKKIKQFLTFYFIDLDYAAVFGSWWRGP